MYIQANETKLTWVDILAIRIIAKDENDDSNFGYYAKKLGVTYAQFFYVASDIVTKNKNIIN